MSVPTLQTVTDQAKSQVNNAVHGATSQLRQQTSITGWANRLQGKTAVQQSAKKERSRAGVYTMSEEAVRAAKLTGGVVFQAPDGYIRKSPMQKIIVPPDYRRRIVLRIGKAAATVAALCLAVYALVQLGFIHI